jgi:hypothetical protein
MASKPQSRRGQTVGGLLALAAGVGVAANAASHLGQPMGKLDPIVLMIAGFALAFVGLILFAPERNRRLKAWLGALMITAIAFLLDWVAFGPGAGSPATRLHFWEVPGRLLLASGAVLFNLMALWAWMRTLPRRAFRI